MVTFLFVLPSNAQEKSTEKVGFFKKYPFVNMTEFGGLFGKNKYQTGANYYYGGIYNPVPQITTTVENRLNFSMQTFNGVYLTKKTAVGLTMGVDWYSTTILTPVALGIRQNIAQKRVGGTVFYGSLDAGYATTWANDDNTNYITKGGLMLNPSVGFKIPMKSGSAWLINVGYKMQKATVSYDNPSDYYFTSNETRNYNRMVVRLGLEF